MWIGAFLAVGFDLASNWNVFVLLGALAIQAVIVTAANVVKGRPDAQSTQAADGAGQQNMDS
jgi:hypothetical protein